MIRKLSAVSLILIRCVTSLRGEIMKAFENDRYVVLEYKADKTKKDVYLLGPEGWLEYLWCENRIPKKKVHRY